MLKRTITFLIVFAITFSCLPLWVNAQDISLSAHSAVLINALTNEVIYEKNAYEKRGMASTTKIMTSLIAIENGNLRKKVVAKDVDVCIEGTSIGLKSGDEISLEVLVAGMLLESGNDAANVTARAVGGTRARFVSLMNKKAKEIGMHNTSFKNPSGLTEEGHYSTAFDMALLGSYAIKNSVFRDICSLNTLTVSYGTPECNRTFKNHNRLLSSFNGSIGVKTGFTKASGRCLVSAAEREGVTLVAVTLSAPDDWNDHTKLLEYGFQKVKKFDVGFNADNIKINVVGSDNKAIGVKLQNGLTYTATKKEINEEIVVFCPHFLYPNVKKGDYVGCVRVYSDDKKLLCQSNLLTTENAPMNFSEKEKNKSFVDRIINYLKSKNR